MALEPSSTLGGVPTPASNAPGDKPLPAPEPAFKFTDQVSKEDQKNIVHGLIKESKMQIFTGQILARFLARRVLAKPNLQGQLGQTQAEVKESIIYLEYLEEILEEY